MSLHFRSALTVATYLLVWLLLRLAALRGAKPARIRSGAPWVTRVVLVYCFALSSAFVAINSWQPGKDAAVHPLPAAIGLVLLVLSLVLSVTSLLHLGSSYSLEIELKDGHSVTRSGPYRIVRHPIYLSDVVGFLGLCLVINWWQAWIVLPGVLLSLYLMAKKEESFLLQHLGTEYENYKTDVRRMLMPGIL